MLRRPCACGVRPAASPWPCCSARRRSSSASATARWMLRFGMSISIRSPSSTRPISAALRRLGRDVADGEARGAAGEAAVGDQGAGLAEALRLQVARRIEHLLHAGAAARALVADDDHVARLDLAVEDALHGRVLALEDDGRAGEDQDALVDAGRLHDAAVIGEVAVEHGEAAILGEGVLARRG